MSTGFRHILVPVDLSGKNAAALDIAFEMATRYGARITLFHVVERIEAEEEQDSEDAELQSFYQELERRAANDLQDLALRFSRAGLTVDSHVWIGKRVPEIVRFAAEHDVDLIVLTAPVMDQERPAQSLASASYHVTLFTTCPVLMVKYRPVPESPESS